MSRGRVLELGCGRQKAPGALGVDRVPLPGVDVVCDLNHVPYPFRDNVFDEVRAVHVIEHLDSIVASMEEIFRIGKPGSRLTLVTPHYSDSISWQDPTHKWHLNSYSFRYFDLNWKQESYSTQTSTDYYTSASFLTLRRHVEMAKLWKWLGLAFLINLDNRFPAMRFVRKFWEQYLCFLLRGKQMTFVFEIRK
jgi:SAM-dependent methyltransferase